MLKQSIIFIALFIFSTSLLLLLSDDVKGDQLFDESLYTTSVIDHNSSLNIYSEQFEELNYNMSDEKINELDEYRIRVRESEDLTDSIEIYTVNMYNDITDKAVIEINNNDITITSDLGPFSTFTSPTFLSYAQFDNNFFISVPFHLYIIYVPVGMTYEFH